MCYLRNLRSGNSRDNGSEGGATALRMLGGQSGIAAAAIGMVWTRLLEVIRTTKDAYLLIMTDFRTELSMRGTEPGPHAVNSPFSPV